MTTPKRPSLRTLAALVLCATGLAMPAAAAKAPQPAAAACPGVERRSKARLEHGLVVCEQKSGTAAVGRCSAAQWKKYTARLRRQGCSAAPAADAGPTGPGRLLPHPILVALRAQGVSADDLATADTEARAAHLALRVLLRRIVGTLDRPSRKFTVADVAQGLLPFRDELRAAIDRVEKAEKILGAVESSLWGGFVTDPALPWLIDEPLRAAVEQLQVELRRFLGPDWHTVVDDLRTMPGCAGDVIGDRLVAAAGETMIAATSDRDEQAAALGRFSAQLACLATQQNAFLDATLTASYEIVATRLRRAGLERLVPAFTRLVAPLQVLVLDTVKHRGENAFAWHWFVDHRDELLDEVDRLGWPTENVVWLYDRISGRMIGFPPCAGAATGRCVDLAAFIRSLADPRALGLGDCALSGMVAAGPRTAGGSSVYACPSLDCTAPASGGGKGAGAKGGRSALGGLGAFFGGSTPPDVSRLPWSQLSSQDITTMRGFSCGGASGGAGGGAGGGSGSDNGGGTQGPGGSLGNWGGDRECFDQALNAPRDPFHAYARCAIGATGAGPSLADPLSQALQGVPMGSQCSPIADGAGSTGSSGGGSATTTTVPATSTTAPPVTTTTQPSLGDQLLDALSNALTVLGFTSSAPSPSAAGAVVSTEIELLKPSNAKTFYDTLAAITDDRLRQDCAGEFISAATCGVLAKMSPADQADYYKWLNQKDCADPESCDSGCTSLDRQVMERTQACDQQFLDDLTPRGPGAHDPGSIIHPSPEADTGTLPNDPLLACLLGNGPQGGGMDLSCAFVTCVNGAASARSASACCGAASPTIGVSVSVIIDQRTCERALCGGGEAVVADSVGSCGCGTVSPSRGSNPGPSGPTPTPGPPQGGGKPAKH